MILVDMSQVQMANLMVGINTYLKNEEIDESLLRHMILNSLRSYRQRFSDDYGELILCYDSVSWRKSVFPHYKANRKKTRDQSGLNWEQIFQSFNKIERELRANFPYPVLRRYGAEADDIIGVLSSRALNPLQEHLIVSGDKDFIQLQKYGNISQYSPVRKEMIKHEDPVKYLEEHIIHGDTGDGIPNILSDDDVLVTEGKRQKPMRKTRMAQLLESVDDNLLRNYHRNKTLIDLGEVPEHIQDDILNTYQKELNSLNGRDTLFSYFVENRLVNLLDVIDEF